MFITRICLTLLLALTLTAPVQAGPKAKPAPPQEVAVYGPDHQYRLAVVLQDTLLWEFQLDTGASDTSIPWTVFDHLWRWQHIGWANMLPEQQYTLADGRVITKMRARLTLTIGTHRLENVVVSIGEKGKPTFSLLGASTLARFQSFGVDHTRGILRLGSPRQP